jgi:hypothetical protein
MRPTRFSEGNFSAGFPEPPISESAISPRFGATVTVPACAGPSAPSTDTTIKRRPSKPFPARWNPYTDSKRPAWF